MIFFIAFDPASVEWAGKQGELGYDHLTGVFECLLQNCFIAETESFRIGPELKAAVRSLSETGTRKKVSALIEALVSRGRLVPLIDDNAFAWDAPIGEILVRQVNHASLDVIVTESISMQSGAVELVRLAEFNQSNFARERSKRASSVVLQPRSLTAAQLFKDYFHRLLLIGGNFTMVDPVIGKNFGSNFSESLVHWCTFLDALDKPLQWTIHTEAGQCPAIQRYIEDRLDGGIVVVHVIPHHSDQLPHDRYFRCAGICIDIGRGIDLFDRDGWIRDVRLGLGDDNQFTKQYPHLG